MSTLGSALWITLIGMGLVFLALLLLWGLMELMMRLTARSAAADEAEAAETAAEEVASQADSSRLARAAAAAVAVALALRQATLPPEGPADAQVSNWQAAMRTARLNQRANMFTRKQRGAGR